MTCDSASREHGGRAPGHRGLRRRAALSGIVALLAAALPVACHQEESPREAVLRFLRAVEEGDREQVYDLLAPESQKLLRSIADRANTHTGGGRRLTPQDLFAVGQERPAAKIGELKVLEVEGDRARVALESTTNEKHQGVGVVKAEVLELIRVENSWRIKLPVGG